MSNYNFSFNLGGKPFEESEFALETQQFGSAHLPASVLYPLITGGVIVFSAIFARIIYKEKPTKFTLIGIALCVLGTCLFL